MVMQEFVPYSVAMARMREQDPATFVPLGTGTFVKKGDRIGILTARHCTHACVPRLNIGRNGTDSLLLVLRNGRSLIVPPHLIYEYPTTVSCNEEFGPDLTFLQILPSGLLQTILAISSVWSLDKTADSIIDEFGSEGTMLASIGFPEVQCKTEINQNDIHRLSHHMTFLNAIGPGDISERDGWDYLRTKCDYSGPNPLPITFEGVSGGAIWGIHARKHKDDGRITIEKSSLIGVTFYQTDRIDNTRHLRGHFIRSVYEHMWR